MSPRAKSEAQRFWPRIDANGVCWEWTGLISQQGYGRFVRAPGATPHFALAHRWCWEHLVGPVPDGLELDHLCRNRRCVNPDHLEPVTHKENLRRGRHAQSEKTRCPAGHKYTEDNIKRTSAGGRACRTCAGQTGRGRGWHADKPQCPQGHPYDEANTYVDGKGYRHCRACRRATERARYRARRAALSASVPVSPGSRAGLGDEKGQV